MKKFAVIYGCIWGLMLATTAKEIIVFICGGLGFGLSPAQIVCGYLVCLLFSMGIVRRWLSGKTSQKVGPRKLLLSGATYLAFLFCTVFMQRTGLREIFNYRNSLLFAGQVYCITILYLQSTLFQKSAIRQELETMNILWRQQKEQYELSKENIALINRKCHDLKHQLAAIQAVGSSRERDAYIQELQKSLNIYDSVVHTGNEVLDTILTEKSLYCEANDIKINCVADGKQMNFIDPVDLYTIMGNAMDNAIESVEKIKEQDRRIIDVLVYVKQKFLVIIITNPVDHQVSFEDGVPLTTKEKNGYHGFGTKSIRHTVHKYNGHASFLIENGCFALKILFPIT